MIKCFKIKVSDEKLISDNRETKLKSEVRAKQDPFDYSRVIVKKPWGYEYLIFENEFVAIWMLHIVRKRKTSMHSHPQKRTSLILLAGNATCSHLEGSEKLNPMEGIVIEEGVFHLTEASSELPIDPQSENGIWVMEIESPPNKADLVRMKDEYGRSGKAYEGCATKSTHGGYAETGAQGGSKPREECETSPPGVEGCVVEDQRRNREPQAKRI